MFFFDMEKIGDRLFLEISQKTKQTLGYNGNIFPFLSLIGNFGVPPCSCILKRSRFSKAEITPPIRTYFMPIASPMTWHDVIIACIMSTLAAGKSAPDVLQDRSIGSFFTFGISKKMLVW